MKIRRGFVSNSSSSSYLIAYRVDATKCKHCGRSDPDITALFEHDTDYQEDHAAIYASGKEEVIAELRGMYGIDDGFHRSYQDSDKYTARFIKESGKVIEKLEEGWEVACIRIPYRDESTLGILQESSNVEFITDWY